MKKQLLGTMLLGLLLTTGCGQDTESVIDNVKSNGVPVNEADFQASIDGLSYDGVLGRVTGVDEEKHIVVLTWKSTTIKGKELYEAITSPTEEGDKEKWKLWVDLLDGTYATEGATYYVEYVGSDDKTVATLTFNSGEYDFEKTIK
ncbi:MAG: hypothetical protein [Malazfec virus 1]